MSVQMQINGHKIELRANKFYLDGKLMVPADGSTITAITMTDTEYTLKLDTDGKIVGDIEGSLSVEGHNVTLIINGKIGGSVNTKGPVTCEKIGGSVNAGTVTCDKVGGSVNANIMNKR